MDDGCIFAAWLKIGSSAVRFDSNQSASFVSLGWVKQTLLSDPSRSGFYNLRFWGLGCASCDLRILLVHNYIVIIVTCHVVFLWRTNKHHILSMDIVWAYNLCSLVDWCSIDVFFLWGQLTLSNLSRRADFDQARILMVQVFGCCLLGRFCLP